MYCKYTLIIFERTARVSFVAPHSLCPLPQAHRLGRGKPSSASTPRGWSVLSPPRSRSHLDDNKNKKNTHKQQHPPDTHTHTPCADGGIVRDCVRLYARVDHPQQQVQRLSPLSALFTRRDRRAVAYHVGLLTIS